MRRYRQHGDLKSLRRIWLLVLLCGVVTWSQVNTGTISGTVKDSTESAIAGATVEILNVGTGISRTDSCQDLSSAYSHELSTVDDKSGKSL